ncbi:MOP flippase family protein [Pedobacter cryoconitis]|uniref:MOP flippase family protein n=1 Tax=Pedobacter cryoconitis TaxID=188932 RepID=UPI00160CE237|nr:MOP flippase family protein [Pedobacter cryoconitis]MBB5646771.1 PST family polysaccharide transporter/lipopolysaccharide exporter [Pedobacter cryoconitis]
MSNKKLAISGAKWTTISTVVNTVLQFVQIAILARLLEPSSFGIVSISTLVITFLGIFAHFGFSNSIVYKQESDNKVLSTIYFLNLMIGAAMFIIIYCGAPLLVMYYKEPRLLEVLHISAFYFPIVFLGQIYNILLEKELKFKSLALTEIVCSILATTITIILAYKGFQAKSLVFGLLAGQTLKMLVQNVIGRVYFSPVWYFKLKEIKEHLMFGIYNIGDSLLGFANSNMDTILIGGLLGVKELGYYTIASQVAIYPVARICPIIVQICYPIMARMKENLEHLKGAYLKIVDFLSYVNIPLLAGLFLMSANVIPLIYGPGWDATVPLIKIFVFTGIFSCLMYPLSTVAYSTGKPKLLFYLNLITLVIKFPLIYIMAKQYGIMGIAYGFLITTFITLVMNFFLIQFMVGDFMKTFLENIAKPLLFSVAMAVVILLYKQFVGNTGTFHTMVQIALGGLVYAGLTLKYKLSFSEIKNLKQSL